MRTFYFCSGKGKTFQCRLSSARTTVDWLLFLRWPIMIQVSVDQYSMIVCICSWIFGFVSICQFFKLCFLTWQIEGRWHRPQWSLDWLSFWRWLDRPQSLYCSFLRNLTDRLHWLEMAHYDTSIGRPISNVQGCNTTAIILSHQNNPIFT